MPYTITFTGPKITDPAQTGSVTVSVPDAVMQGVVVAMLAKFSYPPTIQDENGVNTPNPEDPASFMVRMTREQFWNPIAADYITQQAQTAAAEQAGAQADALLGQVTQAAS